MLPPQQRLTSVLNPEDRKELAAIIKNYGWLSFCAKETNVSVPTVKRAAHGMPIYSVSAKSINEFLERHRNLLK